MFDVCGHRAVVGMDAGWQCHRRIVLSKQAEGWTMSQAGRLPSGSQGGEACALPSRCRVVTGLDLADVRLVQLQVPRRLRQRDLHARMVMEAVRLSGRPVSELSLDYIEREGRTGGSEHRDMLLVLTLRQAVSRHCDQWAAQGVHISRLGVRTLALEPALAWALKEDGQDLPDVLAALHADDQALHLIILDAGAGRYWQSWALDSRPAEVAGEEPLEAPDNGVVAMVTALRQALAQLQRLDTVSVPAHWVLLGERLSHPAVLAQLTAADVPSPRSLSLGVLLGAQADALANPGDGMDDFWIAFGLALQGVHDGRR